ncbi:hypothetical protein [Agrobacterium tumefaciens]|uniref:hypothetical protein n=1 Tax=Agrobacterium tumefaciens TaxID=358 RepID=UPI00129BC7A0|nr:hypothetical protein [Agrobacterium tumefaciens]MRH93917.1 hypothetical protein [Agrobacterium tumefaciens]
MSELHKKRLLTLAGLVLASAICLPVIFGEPRKIKDQSGGDSWRNVIYDFQTLITGFFAIGAAYMTVRYALKIDDRQQRRHQQIMSFTVRKELGTLERALYPQLSDLAEAVESLWDTNRDPKDKSPLSNWKWFTQLTNEYRDQLHRVNDVTQRQQFTDALPYFDGRLSRAYFEFRSSYSETEKQFQEHVQALSLLDAGYDNLTYEHIWAANHVYIASCAVGFVIKAEALERELKRASGEYQSMVERYRHI